MAWETFKIEVPDGSRLGVDHDMEGAFRALLFDVADGGLVGHAHLFKATSEEGGSNGDFQSMPEGSGGGGSPRSESAEASSDEDEGLPLAAIATLTALAVMVVATGAWFAPQARGWWKGKVRPALRRAKSKVVEGVEALRSRLAGGRGTDSAGREEAVVSTIVFQSDISRCKLEAAVAAYMAAPGDEYMRHYVVEAIVSNAFSGNKLDSLQNIEIEGYGDFLQVGTSAGLLTPELVGATLDRLLAKTPGLLEPQSIVGIANILGGGGQNGRTTPLQLERVGRG